MQLFFKTLISLLMFSACTVSASSRLYSDNTLLPSDGFAWDWTFGASAYIEDPYLIGMPSNNKGFELELTLSLSYDNLFVDIDNSQLSGGFIIGYTLPSINTWQLDIIGTQIQKGFNETGLELYKLDVLPELAGINARAYDYNAGLRLSKRFSDSLFSIELLNDISNAHNGWILSSFFSHITPWRNWEFRAAVGLNAYSPEFTDYYFGITPNEVTPFRPSYSANTSFSLVTELHAEYPLNEHWIFLAGWMSTLYSEDIYNSPIIRQYYHHKAKVGVRYVF
ncbi:MipA/OmpV family protein [Pseudoalteromonas sp. MMG013]|uniref:MipA/OmpV family protein n=1 Tax=Pseudoalteromonas aurantia 208 TaxID=1314867 RepID=A0ABR9EAR0_9GAMM|nr:MULTISPECIES: MipA/OmpV family protein [Pseudoalteromonas]MBE0367459.1 hypothetical protein [Pseudoalteromonas aurantia 208]MBQ4845830.1 MipA/OmpV family protein [Pseudoalteromonas sp. MMG005]MBQ4849084.1 MipA/OmpV family protein [Pseudoalteromonas sp. MMG012]MBQ4861911.1 MipA/OmpV family protein [Pseudoalteromonas sp. MMG013]